jgi:hypothetical protein
MTIPDLGRRDPALLQAALALAQRGWHVFPCAPGSKRPALRGSWQQLATVDLARVHRWWSCLPYNIGLACGPSKLVILDLDLPRGGCTPRAADPIPRDGGTDVLAGLFREHGEPFPPATFTVRTPSGGYHLYYAAPATTVRNSAGRLGRLIDVRAHGGYVIAPGSRIGGVAYAVTDPAPLAPLPTWIAQLLSEHAGPSSPLSVTIPNARISDASAYAMAALHSETHRVASAAEGTRNDTLNRAAFSLGQLVAAGILPALAVSTALADAASAAGLPLDETCRTIRSGMTAGLRNPRQHSVTDGQRSGSSCPEIATSVADRDHSAAS